MSTIPDSFRDTFSDSFRDLVGQKKSRLMKTVNVARGLTGISKEIGFAGDIEDEEVTGQRFKKVTVSEIETSFRWYFPQEFQAKHFESAFDEVKLAPRILGSGTIITKLMQAYMRRADKVIMANLLGNAHVGTQGNTTPTAVPSTQIVPVDFVATGSDADSSLTAGKLIEAKRLLQANEAWNEDIAATGQKIWCVIDSDIESKLRHAANLASGDRLYSSDFGGIPVFDENGFLTRWGAVNFVIYEGLLTGSVTGASTTVTAKKVPFYTSSSFEYGVWADVKPTVDIRPDLSNAVQFLAQYSVGGGREQEEKVVQINCLTT